MAKRVPQGVIELADGLYLMAGYSNHSRSIAGYAGASVYLLRGRGKECVLIDSGYERFTEPILALLGEMGVTCSDIKLVAYTHSHGDHMESCKHYQGHGAITAVHESAHHADDWGGKPVEADRFFRDGDVLEAAGLKLEVVHTPGHTPDSSAFLTEIGGRRVLFVGDLAGWFFPERGSNLRQMIASVEKLRKLGAELVCGGHWVCDYELDAYWDKLARSVGDGIFNLVDGHKAKDHYDVTARRWLGGEP